MPSRLRILLWSALSGVLWALAWPAIGGMSWLAFVAWLPLLHAERLHAARTQEHRRAFYPYVLVATFIWNLSCSWWFYCVSEPLATRLISVGAPVLVNTFLMGVPWWLKRAVHRTHGARVAEVAFIFFWLAFERLHHAWDLQWPWFSIGNVFGTHPHWVQWYELTGMLGGSLWVLVVTMFIDRSIIAWQERAAKAWVGLAVAIALFAFPLALSLYRFHRFSSAGERTIEVVVVQPNIDPYKEKFGGLDPMEQLERMLQLAEGQMTDGTRLVVFPETALQEGTALDLSTGVPLIEGLWENDLDASRSVQRLRQFQKEHPHAALLCGMNSARLYRDRGAASAPRPIADSRYWYESYNAALWLPEHGGVASYHKSKLVAGPELMPFEAVLGPLGDYALDLGGTTGTLGQQEERTVLRSADVALAPAICYESVFGEHVAAHVRNGAGLIAVITNDGWWDESPGYKQHLTFSSLRAIETRRCVVRSANTGISCTVDQRGVIDHRTAWWTPAAFRANVPLSSDLTFFTRQGDLIGRSAVLITVLLLVMTIARRSRRRRSV